MSEKSESYYEEEEESKHEEKHEEDESEDSYSKDEENQPEKNEENSENSEKSENEPEENSERSGEDEESESKSRKDNEESENEEEENDKNELNEEETKENEKTEQNNEETKEEEKEEETKNEKEEESVKEREIIKENNEKEETDEEEEETQAKNYAEQQIQTSEEQKEAEKTLEIQRIENHQTQDEKINIGVSIHEPETHPHEDLRSAPRSPRSFTRKHAVSTERSSTSDFRNSLPEFKAPEVTREALEIKAKAIRLEHIPQVSDDIFTQAIYSLSEDRKAKIQQHKFVEGAKINRAIDHLKEYQVKYQKKVVTEQAQNSYKEMKATVEKELEDFDKETKKLTKEFEAKLKKQRSELLDKHEVELDEHEKQWKSEQTLKQFNHASAKLTTLRLQMTSLLLQCRFEEAGVLEKEANEQKAREEAQNYETYQQRFNESQKKLMDKQAEEVAAFDNSFDTKVQRFLNERARARRPLENKEKRVELAKAAVSDKERVWNKEKIRRSTENCGVSARSMTLAPSNRVTRQDILQNDYTLLSLPPLKSTRRKTRRQSKNSENEEE